MSRYSPSRHYLHASLAALAGAALSAAMAITWPLTWIAVALFAASAAALGWLGLQHPIEIHETHLVMGRRRIAWADVRRLDSTRWRAPLVVRLTLFDDRRLLLVFPGDPPAAAKLLRQMRRLACHALIEGMPYRRFWGDPPPAKTPRKPPASPRQRLLRTEDEAEVEKLFQRLKAVGHLDSRSQPDDE